MSAVGDDTIDDQRRMGMLSRCCAVLREHSSTRHHDARHQDCSRSASWVQLGPC